ncbi:hypothetical protein VTJ04DRAFT_2617 [Mycothermus thermophilus]|uniref:uncharacterized protein n=1 Tax=Humicola insolens TaxID=85995 RepID=UPI00374416CD
MHGDTTERPTLKLKARKASRVFRTKLRSLFGSSSSQSRDQHRSEDRDRAGHNGGKEAQLPPQHISSRRSPDIPAILYPSGSYDDGRGNVGGVDHHNHANENGQAPTTPSQKAALRSTPSRTITIVRSPTPTKMLPRSREVSVEGYDQHSNPSNDRKENPQPATGTTSMVNNQDKNNASDNVQSNRNPSSSTAESNDTVSSSSLTSWFHSGPSTLTSVEQRQWREWEAKQMALQQQLQERLGVVGESDQSPGAGRNGDTGPTIRRRTLGELTNDGADVHGEGETATAPRPMVSSDRIYSALVKRMRERDGRALPSAFANEHHEVQEKKYGLSADSSYHDSSKTPDTIRHVPVPSQSDDEQPWRCHSRTSSSSVRTTIVNTPTRSSKKPPVGSDPARRTNQTWERSASMSTDVLGQRRWREEAEERKGWVEDDEGTGRSSNSRAWRKLGHQRQESPSNFAVVGESGTASPASNHLFRTQSSYRRALKRSMMEEEQKVWARHSSGTDWNAREDEQEDKWDREKKRWLDPSAQNDDVEPAETSVRYSESVQSSDEEDEAGPLRSAIDNGLSSAAHSHHRDPSAASSTDWMLSLSAHVGKLEAQKAMASPSKKITGTNEWGDSASQGRQLRNTAGSHRHNYHSAGLGHIREAAQVEDGRLSDEDDDSNYGDDPNASPAKPADHDVFHPAAHRHNVLQQQQKHQIDYYYPTGPLKQVEPNLPPSTATQHYTPENEIIRSNAKLQSVWDTASYVPHTNENRNPSYQAHAQQHATPPPIPPKSKLRQQQESPQLRPEPLRIMRQRPRTGVHTPVGLGPGPGPGTGSGVASPAASVLSSPGLTEAFMKQFGGGGGGGGKGMASLSGMVKGTEGSSPAFI